MDGVSHFMGCRHDCIEAWHKVQHDYRRYAYPSPAICASFLSFLAVHVDPAVLKHIFKLVCIFLLYALESIHDDIYAFLEGNFFGVLANTNSSIGITELLQSKKLCL